MKTLQESIIGKRGNSVANEFGISKKDMIGDLEGFPVGVVVKMMEEQESQVHKPDVKVFQRRATAAVINGGFDWYYTEDGSDFWNLLMEHDFERFFRKYPEYKKYGE